MTIGMFMRLMWGGLQFDLVAVLYTNMLFIVLMIMPFDFRFRYGYLNFARYLFFLTNGFAIALNVSDFVYYRFTLRRTTADVFKQFENEQNMGGLLGQFVLDYWYAVACWLFLVIVMVKLYNGIRIWGRQTTNAVTYYVAGVVMVFLIAYLVVGGIRGGFRHSTRPITLSNAGAVVKDPRDISIVLNTPFTLIRTIGKTKVQRASYFSEEEVGRIYSPEHYPTDTASFAKKNVVVIILESFSKEFFGAFNQDLENGQYKGYTPFLDSLIQHSLTFEHSFANGRKSIDGLPSVISSIPATGVPYFLSPYSGNRINSLASLLKRKGYHTSFFHGAPNGSMGFQAFMNLAGVEEYYGMDEYNNDEHFDGLWGIWDHHFLQFYSDKLGSFPQPFMSSIFTVSSHHPFVIPHEFNGRFDKGTQPIHQCIQYTDHALREFFREVSKSNWYKNTIFVITADHTSSNVEFDQYRTAWGLYAVPIIFFSPGDQVQGRMKEVTQQIDIMPTVLGMLHYPDPYVAFGRDVTDQSGEPFAFNYKDNVYQLFQGDYLLMFDGTRSLGLYNFKTDKLIENNLLDHRPEVVAEMETFIKAIIQQYNNRMIDDKLTISTK